MRYQLCMSADAEADLEGLFETDETAAAVIAVLLEELQSDDDMLDALTAHGYVRRSDPAFDVSKWFEHWNRGVNLWRLKPITPSGRTSPYRVIYAFVPQLRRYVVLGIVPRNFEYAPDHPLTERILNAYSEI